MGIDPELITGIAGELQSFVGLSKKVKEVDKALGDRIHAIEKEQTYYRIIGAVALALDNRPDRELAEGWVPFEAAGAAGCGRPSACPAHEPPCGPAVYVPIGRLSINVFDQDEAGLDAICGCAMPTT